MSGNTISKQKKQIFALMLALVMAVSLFPGAGAKGADLSTYTAGSSLVDAGDILANPTFFSVEYWDYYDTLISSLSGAAEYDEIDGMFRYPVEAIPNEVTQWRVHQLSYSDGYIDKIVFKIPEYVYL